MDKEEALDFLKRVAEGIACMFGNSCETVIHDMDNKEHSVLAIYHGEVTNRKLGGSFSILGIKEVDEFFKGKDVVNCLATTKEGRLIKSSTFHLNGDDYHYALGINYDFTHLSLAKTALEELISVGETIEDALNTSGNLLQDIFDECLKIIGKPVALFTKEDRLKIIPLLMERGAFDFYKGIPTIAEKLNISRYTLYKYLREQSWNNNADNGII